MKLKIISLIIAFSINSICSIAFAQESKICSSEIIVESNIWETKEHGAGDFFPNLTLDSDTSGKSSWRGERIDRVKPWIQYDLRSPIEVSHINIAFYNGDKRNYFIEILISDDKENWESIFNGKSNGETLDFEKFDINKKARFIKIIGNGNNHKIYFNWTNITEVKIYKM